MNSTSVDIGVPSHDKHEEDNCDDRMPYGKENMFHTVSTESGGIITTGGSGYVSRCATTSGNVDHEAAFPVLDALASAIPPYALHLPIEGSSLPQTRDYSMETTSGSESAITRFDDGVRYMPSWGTNLNSEINSSTSTLEALLESLPQNDDSTKSALVEQFANVMSDLRSVLHDLHRVQDDIRLHQHSILLTVELLQGSKKRDPDQDLLSGLGYTEDGGSSLCRPQSSHEVPTRNQIGTRTRKLGSPHKVSKDEAPMPGVRYARDRNSWVAFWNEGGRQSYKSFSRKKFGYEKARQLAIEARSNFNASQMGIQMKAKSSEIAPKRSLSTRNQFQSWSEFRGDA